MFVLILFLAPAYPHLWHIFLFSLNFICHSFTKQCSAVQNDVIKCDLAVQIAVALKIKSDAYPIQYHI